MSGEVGDVLYAIDVPGEGVGFTKQIRFLGRTVLYCIL